MRIIGLAFFSLYLFASNAIAIELAPGKYVINKEKSRFAFSVTNMIFFEVEGRFDEFDGAIEVGNGIATLKAKAWALAKTVNTENKSRDEHLRDKDFFDANKFEKLMFETTSADGAPDGFNLNGTLTIRGILQPVTFVTKLLGGDMSSGYDFEATTKIDRRKFGINYGGPMGNEVRISLRVHADKSK